jgi:hypothetical protein
MEKEITETFKLKLDQCRIDICKIEIEPIGTILAKHNYLLYYNSKGNGVDPI